MASVSNDKNGFRRILFTAPDKTRKTIRIGRVDKKSAENIRRHIEALLASKLSGQPVPRDTAGWLGSIGDSLRAKLASVGLCEAGPEATTLGRFLEDYFSRRPDVTAGTVANWQRTERVLLAYFGPTKPLASILSHHARDFERWLRTPEARVLLHGDGVETLATATIRRRIGIARQFFNDAQDRGLIPSNPFKGLSATVTGNAGKRRFITREDTSRLLDVCPNASWCLLVALARFGGVRVPSESHTITWNDVDWTRKRIRIHSPKTARHAGHEAREIPLFPELVQPLLDAFESCPEGEKYCVYGIGKANPGTHLTRLIRKAGLTPWPKPWVNLRASRATELVADFPSHVAASWLGHSQAIATEHYLMVTGDDFAKAAQNAAHSVAQNAAQTGADQKRQDRTDLTQVPVGQHLGPILSDPVLSCTDVLMGATGFEPVTIRV